MKINWLGHACFLVETSGLKILIDPFDDSVGYPILSLSPDIVLISHEHHDHSAASLWGGKPILIREAGERSLRGVEFRGIATFHDDFQGEKSGKNLIFTIFSQGISLCHLGDLGHLLSLEQLQEIGRVDVLMIPVGGIYTIDALDAHRVVQQLLPRIVIPMHYWTSVLRYPLDSVDKFISGKNNVRRQSTMEITRETLPETLTYVVLDYRFLGGE